ncbi:hypothetical protein ACS0TY_000276 [Phlomoides rotata]
MGEVVVSSEGGMELEFQETAMETEKSRHAVKLTSGGGGSAAPAAVEATEGDSSAVRWERFLPKMAVRVLLVEADDSTRQIISALLRKCSYKVAAVGDGLKAWEVLKGRPHSIDLILTEVELPSISGYALLTLIMEHETCKNIPVIMMSQQDSVSTVYKCMLRGATDFLVKPVRKNELRNLWQHVWRKQASSTGAGLGPPDESVALEKEETTAENNAISNHSSGYMSCIQKNKEGIEKGSDAQSSCSKPESETEVEDIEHDHQPSKKRRALDNETGEVQAVANADADRAITQDRNSDGIKVIGENVENNHSLENSSKEAIDLIGTFDNHIKSTFGTSESNVNTSMFDILPLLDLSLRRSPPSGSMNLVNDDERPRMNHSDASPFSRYINKPMQFSNQQKDHENSSEKEPSNKAPEYNPDAHDMNSPKHVSMETFQTGKPEFRFSYSQNREISHPIAVRGVRYENVVNAYGSVLPSTYSAQSGSSSLPSPATTHHSESIPQPTPFYPSDHQPPSSQQLHGFGDQRISNSVDQMENKQGNKLEDLEDEGFVSPGNDQSGNSNINHHQSSGSGSSKINAIPVITIPSECGSGNDETFHINEGASHRSLQREAALTKFRQKRKDRCFEKKVRYESRKKLAEQRPRVKGQFVRQPQPGN